MSFHGREKPVLRLKVHIHGRESLFRISEVAFHAHELRCKDPKNDISYQFIRKKFQSENTILDL